MCSGKVFCFSVIVLALAVGFCRGEYGFFSLELEDIDSGTTSPTGQYRWLDVAENLYAASYRDSYDYTQADVQICYLSDANCLFGTLYASDLKPNFAYQMKLVGTAGSAANELVGFAGRWWQEEWSETQWGNGQNLNDKGDGTFPNPNDELYLERRDVNDLSSPTGKHYRFTGYMVFDYFITDSEGSAVVDFETDSSYHVLWKTSQRARGSDDGPIRSVTFDPDPCEAAYDADYGESMVEIFGEWERLPVGGVVLSEGSYDVSVVLTEESFHSCSSGYGGCWAGAMGGELYFTVPLRIVDSDELAAFSQEWLSAGTDLAFDLDDSNSVNLGDYSIFAGQWLKYWPKDW